MFNLGQTGLVQQISFSSVDYTMSMEHEDDTQVSSEQNQSPEEQVSVISVQQLHNQPDAEVTTEQRMRFQLNYFPVSYNGREWSFI